jgi:hypothetical protein
VWSRLQAAKTVARPDDTDPGQRHDVAMRTPHRSAALLLAVLAALAALAACTTSPSASSASPTTMTEAQVLVLARELAQCLREHGVPDLPDPVMVDGRPEFPDISDGPSGSVERAMTECRSISDRLRTATAGSGQEEQQPPLSAEDLAKARRYAECMREHGLTGFPDPDSTGLFHVEGTPVQELLQQKDPVPQRVNDAMQACREFAEYPGWGIRN